MNNIPNLTKCIIYCRVSTPDQVNNGNGIDSQEQLCRQWARNRDLSVERVFIDAGISGKNTECRDELNKMLAFLEKSKERYLILFYDICACPVTQAILIIYADCLKPKDTG